MKQLIGAILCNSLKKNRRDLETRLRPRLNISSQLIFSNQHFHCIYPILFNLFIQQFNIFILLKSIERFSTLDVDGLPSVRDMAAPFFLALRGSKKIASVKIGKAFALLCEAT